MRTKSLLLLMLALGCGLVASIGITQVMAKRSGPSGAAGETAAIYVALKDIPTRDKITAELLKLEEWPADKVPEGALTKLEDVEGRRPKSKIYAGSVILDTQLYSKGMSGSGAAPQIPQGYRVISVSVNDETGASDLIRPEDRVDVLWYVKANPGSGLMETCTRTILQDVKVFAVNDVFNLEAMEGDESMNARTVSLLVKPKQVEAIALARELGTIRLALRSHEDTDFNADLDGTSVGELNGTEGSTRAREEVGEDPSADKSDETKAFRDIMLAGSHPPEIWSTRIIFGGKVQDVRLETQPVVSSDGSRFSGLSFWKLFSGPPTGGQPALDAEGGGDQPAEEEPKEP